VTPPADCVDHTYTSLWRTNQQLTFQKHKKKDQILAFLGDCKPGLSQGGLGTDCWRVKGLISPVWGLGLWYTSLRSLCSTRLSFFSLDTFLQYKGTHLTWVCCRWDGRGWVRHLWGSCALNTGAGMHGKRPTYDVHRPATCQELFFSVYLVWYHFTLLL